MLILIITKGALPEEDQAADRDGIPQLRLLRIHQLFVMRYAYFKLDAVNI